MKEVKKFSNSNKNIAIYPSDSNKNLLIVDSILEKWSKLQKAIKEGIILKELIIKQQKVDFAQLKENFIEYYNTKLKIRNAYEEIEMLKDSKKKYKNIFFKKNAEEIFLKSLKPINDFLFIFRNNYDYVIQLIELIELENEKNNNNSNDGDNKYNNYYYKNSIIELFCNQFYDNILIPNPEQEELLILIYKLIEREINNINEPSLDTFLNENTFLGKFINYLMRKPEIKIFLSRLLSPLIIYIENENETFDISIFSKNLNNTNNNTNTTVKENNEKDNNEENNILYNNLFDKIPKTKIKFKNFLELEEQKEKESQIINNIDMEEINDNEKNTQTKTDTNVSDYNDEYKEELSEEIINQKINNTNNNDLKEFYTILLEQIKAQPIAYINSHLLSLLNADGVKEKQEENINKLKKSFLLIQSQIDILLQSLIDKITAIPYIIRCICKIISKLLLSKFPKISKYIHNCFIGKFIFEKFIFPALTFKNNNIMENRIFSSKTKDFLNNIVNILSNAIKCELFNGSTEPMKLIFNHYLIEIIPLLNKFYDKLIEVKFPNFLKYLTIKRTKKKHKEKKNKDKKNKKIKNEEKNKVNIHLINNKNLDNQDEKLSPKLSNYKDNKNNNNLNISLINHKTKNEKIKSLYLRLNEENDLTSYQNKFKLMKEKKKIRNRTQENFYDNSKLISVTKTLDKNNLNEKRDIYLNLNENYYKVKNKSGKSKSQEKQRKILKNSSFDNNNSYVYQNSIMRKIRLLLIKIIKRLDYSNILKKKLNKWRFISNDNELKNLNLQKYKVKAKQNKRYRKSSSSDKSKIHEINEISITENLQRPKRIKKDKIIISIYKKKNPFEQINPNLKKQNYKTSIRNIEKYNMKYENNTNLTDINISQKHFISLNDSSLDKSIDSKLSPVIYKYSKENNALLHSNIDYYRSSNDDSFHNEEYLQVLKQQNKFLLSHKMLLIYRKFHEDKNKQLKKFIKKWRSKNGYFTNYLNIYFHIIRKNNHCITCTCNIKCNLNGCVLSNYTDCMKCYCENTFNLLKKIMFSLYGLREVNIERYIFHLWYKKVFYKKLDS